MDKCFYCKGLLENSTTNYMADLGDRFVIIRNVPCHKCKQCGEVSFSGTTVARIESIIAQLKAAFTEIAIVEYAA